MSECRMKLDTFEARATFKSNPPTSDVIRRCQLVVDLPRRGGSDRGAAAAEKTARSYGIRMLTIWCQCLLSFKCQLPQGRST